MLAGSADVWFTFTAPASGIAIIETGAGTLADGAMALYTATACGGTYALVQCDDDTGPGFMPFLTFNNLVPGQVYYVRVWGYGVATGTFTLCIHGPTSMPPGACVYALQLYDNFGDGWGGSFITVTVNGVPYGTYTCDNAYNVFLIGVNIGQVLVIQYTAVGPFEGDNHYTLSFLSSSQIVYNSGTPPPTGVVYSTTITCAPPPAAQEDCIGGTTLCNNQGINNNTNNTGSVADLNASNFGCLLASEVQGTWYNFVISSGGTLGMAIAPVGAVDYDWAIWGPFPPGSTANAICPPLGQPIRCSFASGLDSFFATGSYVTGMANALYAAPQFAPPLPAYSDPAGTGDGWTPGINVTTGQVYLMYISNFSNNGQSFSMSWQLGSGASLDCTVLPIELMSFEADPAGQDVLLRWSTATEQGTSHFTVERSDDGSAFTAIGSLDAAGNSASSIDYHLIDRAPVNGLNYYRLKGTDLDGAHTYSSVEVVDMTSMDPLSGPFPNPVEGEAWWLLPSGKYARSVDVIDALGRVQLHVPSAELSNGVVHLSTADIPAGSYAVVAYCEDGSPLARARFIKR